MTNIRIVILSGAIRSFIAVAKSKDLRFSRTATTLALLYLLILGHSIYLYVDTLVRTTATALLGMPEEPLFSCEKGYVKRKVVQVRE